MIPTEGTNSEDNLIDFLQRFPVHELVEFLKVGFDGCVIEAAGFIIGIEQHIQNALGIVRIVWLLSGQLGVIAGLAPTFKAMAIKPVDAMREE